MAPHRFRRVIRLFFFPLATDERPPMSYVMRRRQTVGRTAWSRPRTGQWSSGLDRQRTDGSVDISGPLLRRMRDSGRPNNRSLRARPVSAASGAINSGTNGASWRRLINGRARRIICTRSGGGSSSSTAWSRALSCRHRGLLPFLRRTAAAAVGFHLHSTK